MHHISALKRAARRHISENFSALLWKQITSFFCKKGMGNLKYLKPSDEGILQFLSNSIEIWSRDQFFHENQLSYIARVKFLLI